MQHHLDLPALRRTSRVLTAGTWFIIGGVVLYSLMTTTPFVAAHSEWTESGPVLGLMTDAAFIMALQADSVLARHRVANLGPWPRAFRWFTGLATLFLNVWASVQKHDATGVAVHALAPVLLLIVSEVAPVYRRAMADLIADAEVAAAELAAAEAAELAGPEPEPEVAEVPEVDETEVAEVAELFPAPPRPRRSHDHTSAPRGGTAVARGLEMLELSAERGNPLSTAELVEKLDVTPRHAQNILNRWKASA